MSNVLTHRQIELVDMVATGRTIKEVADVLKISPQTVFNTLSKIYDKLSIPHNLSSLAIWRVCTRHSIELPEFIRKAGAFILLALFTLTLTSIDNEYVRSMRCRTRARRTELLETI